MPFRNPILGGNQLVRTAIQSLGYVPGTSGWQITRAGGAEFNNALIRGELDMGPASPNPRVAVNPNIPSALVNWSAPNVVFNVVWLWYFNATDYYWQGIGTWYGVQMYMEGTYDTVNGPYAIRRILHPSAAAVEERWGSYLLNSFPLLITTQQATLQIGDGSNISDTLKSNGFAVPLGIPKAPTSTSSNGTATSGTTETLDTVLGTYQFTALAGRRYRVWYTGVRLNGSVANDLYEFRIRNGGASTPTAASTLVAASAKIVSVVGGVGQETCQVTATFMPGAGTVTLGAFLVRTAGTGVGTPTALRELSVEDIGGV